MRISIRNLTSAVISTPLGQLDPAGSLVSDVPEVQLEGTVTELAKLGSRVSFSVGGSEAGDTITSLSKGVGAAFTNSTAFMNCTTAIQVAGPTTTVIAAPAYIVHNNNTTFLSILQGGRVKISSAITPTNSGTEISLDGVAYTLADMRAASPKLLTNAYGSIVYE